MFIYFFIGSMLDIDILHFQTPDANKEDDMNGKQKLWIEDVLEKCELMDQVSLDNFFFGSSSNSHTEGQIVLDEDIQKLFVQRSELWKEFCRLYADEEAQVNKKGYKEYSERLIILSHQFKALDQVIIACLFTRYPHFCKRGTVAVKHDKFIVFDEDPGVREWKKHMTKLKLALHVN